MSDPQMQALRAHRNRLLKAGLPYTTVRRHLKELRDHHAELTTDAVQRGMSSDHAAAWALQQLGSLDLIGDEMLANTTKRSLWSRYPRFMTLAASPLLFMGALIAVALTMAGLVLGVETQFGREQLLASQSWLEPVCWALKGLLLYVIPLLLGLQLARRQVWQRLPIGYLLVGLVLLAVITGTTHLMVTWPASLNGDDGTIEAAVGAHWAPANILRLVMTLAISAAGWLWWRRERDSETLI